MGAEKKSSISFKRVKPSSKHINPDSQRVLKIAPIVHTQEETRIPASEILQERIKKAWEVIEPVIRDCYQDWSSVQLYVDGFVIPEKFKDPKMTVKEWKERWHEELGLSPLGRLVKDLREKGARLESTDINDMSWWFNYKSILIKTLKSKTPTQYSHHIRKLGELDKERDKFIVSNIKNNLESQGLLLIGRAHLENLKKQKWEDIRVEFL